MTRRPEWAKAYGRRGAALHGLREWARSEAAYLELTLTPTLILTLTLTPTLAPTLSPTLNLTLTLILPLTPYPYASPQP